LVSPLHTLLDGGSIGKDVVDLSVRAEALRTVGSLEDFYTVAGIYFNSVHLRMTIVSKKRFLERVAEFPMSASADFAALCLAINLIIQRPSEPVSDMKSPLYASLKSIIGILEGSNYHSLELVQCRLLCAFYELGHGLIPAASVSIGACSRVARVIGLDARADQAFRSGLSGIAEEERRRVWWALLNLDR
jgi:hypothetical protein